MKQTIAPVLSAGSTEWIVLSDNGEPLKFACNADAWRWIDKETGSPLSPAQARSAYWWRKAWEGKSNEIQN